MSDDQQPQVTWDDDQPLPPGTKPWSTTTDIAKLRAQQSAPQVTWDDESKPKQAAATSPSGPTVSPYSSETRMSYAKPGPYVTKLADQDEQKFQSWVKQNNVPLEDDGPKTGYDLRGFWKAAQNGDPDAKTDVNPFDHQIHYSDKWKTPYSTEGFSRQSVYAKPNAPQWYGDDNVGWRLIGADGSVYSQQGVKDEGKFKNWMRANAPEAVDSGSSPLSGSPDEIAARALAQQNLPPAASGGREPSLTPNRPGADYREAAPSSPPNGSSSKAPTTPLPPEESDPGSPMWQAIVGDRVGYNPLRTEGEEQNAEVNHGQQNAEDAAAEQAAEKKQASDTSLKMVGRTAATMLEGSDNSSGPEGGGFPLLQGVPNLARSAADVATAQNRNDLYRAGSHFIQGTTEELMPAFAAGLIEKPLEAAGGLAVGLITAKGAQVATKAAGGSQEAQDFAEQAGFFIPALTGLNVEAKTGEGGTGVGFTMFGGKVAGAGAINPGEGTGGVGVKVGDNVFQKIWPSGAPNEPSLEAPTIQGEAGAVSTDQPAPRTPAGQIAEGARVDEAVQAMAKKDAIDKMAQGIVTGQIPPTPPPQTPPEPPKPPNTEIKQASLDMAARHLATMPEGQRGAALIQAHQTLAGALMHAGTVVGPDGKLYEPTKPEQAQKLAMKWINDTIASHAKAQQEAAKQQGKTDENVQNVQKGAETPEQPAVAWDDETPTVGSKEEPVIPETQATIGKQMEALRSGNVNVVMVPKGQDAPSAPTGFVRMTVDKGPGAGTYIYNPQQYKASQIRKAAETGTHGAMLGHIQSKPELAGKPTVVVQATAKDGTPIQDSEVVDHPGLIDAQSAVLQERHPDASINVKRAEEVAAQRIEGGVGEDDQYKQAVAAVKEHGKASTSLIQRKLRIGYGEAARLVDRMRSEGLVEAKGAVPAVKEPELKEAKLPADLRGSKPRYGYKDKNFELKFANDVDRALYTVAQKVPNKAHDRFMTWLRGQFPGESDPAIFQRGKTIRESIKPLAAEADPKDGPLEVPTLALPPKKKEAETQTASPKAGEPGRETPAKALLTTEQLPDYAKQAVLSDSAMRRTNEGKSIKATDPYEGVRWREETVPLESLKSGNEMLWGGGSFKPRGSVTKGPIVVNDRGEIIDGNNRAFEAIRRGDSDIKIYRAERSTPPAKGVEHKYKFGNTQANIHGNSEAADAMRLARARISEADLAPQGNDELGGELEPHVTVRYGIQGKDTSGIRDYLRQQAPFEASLGKTGAFPASEHSEGAAPIIAPIESPELHRINKELEGHGDFAKPSFPEYKPHATIAYVKAEAAEKYKGMDVTEGKKFKVTKIAITDRDGNQEVVPLEGSEQPSTQPESVKNEITSGAKEARPGQYPGALNVPKRASLSPEERTAERRFAQQVQKDVPAAIQAYRDLPESQDGRFISADIAKQLSPDYQMDPGKFTYAVHPTSSRLAGAITAEMLKTSPKPTTFSIVSGPPGAGKTAGYSSVDLHASDINKVVYEGSIRSAEDVANWLATVREAGHDPQFVYVYADPITAMRRVAERAMGPEGRIVPIDYMLDVYEKQPQAALALIDKLGNSVGVRILDNSVDGQPGRIINPDELDRIRYTGSRDELRKQFEAELRSLRAAGKLSESGFQRIVGSESGQDHEGDAGLDSQGNRDQGKGAPSEARAGTGSVETQSEEPQEPISFGMTVPGVPQAAEWTVKSAKAFWKADVQDVLERFGIGMTDATRMLVSSFYPRIEETSMIGRATGTGAKRDAVDAFMKLKGERDRAMFVLEQLGKGIKDYWDHAPEAERIDFLDRYKTGQSQKTPELNRLADLYRKMDDEMYHAVEQYRPGLNQLENHFRLFWKVIPGSKQQQGGGLKNLFSRRPLQGSRGMLKKHTLATASEGLQKGGELVTTNPQSLFELGQIDSLKFVSAQKFWQTLKDLGHRQWVADGDKLPEGFDWLPDNIAEVYFPAKVRYEAAGKEYTKPVHVGRWAVEQSSLRILKNFVSRDYIRESAVGSALMMAKNSATAFELAISPFHAVFETIEAMGSQFGLGAMRMWNQGIRLHDGKAFLTGLKDVFSAPLAPYLIAREGGNMIAFASAEAKRQAAGLNLPEPSYPALVSKIKDLRQMAQETRSRKYLAKHPDAMQLLDDLFTGGAQLDMHKDYETQTLKTIREAWQQGNPFGAFLRVFPAMSHQVMRPLFGVYIPRLKVGFFLKQYSQQLEERHADLASGRITRSELARKVWQSTENRFGEMNFDNVMWNRTLKSTLQFAFRSVTWKMGNVSLFAGAGMGQGKDVLEWLHAIEPYDPAGGSGGGVPPGGGKGPTGAGSSSSGKMPGEKAVPHLDMNMAWVLGVAAMTALMATIWTLVHTGKSPWQWAKEDDDSDTTFGQSMALYRELANPRNGDYDYNGKPMRASMPTYWRDLQKAESNPKRYITGSFSSVLSRSLDVMENSDYRGNYVYDPNASIARQFMDVAGYVAPKPFSIANYQAVTAAGSGEGAKVGGAFGFTRAPSDIDFSKAEKRLSDILSSREERKTPEEIEQGKEDRERIRDGELGGKALRKAQLNDALPLVVRLFKSPEISYSAARDIYENYATSEEQIQLRPYLMKKRASALRRDPERVMEAEQ